MLMIQDYAKTTPYRRGIFEPTLKDDCVSDALDTSRSRNGGSMMGGSAAAGSPREASFS